MLVSLSFHAQITPGDDYDDILEITECLGSETIESFSGFTSIITTGTSQSLTVNNGDNKNEIKTNVFTSFFIEESLQDKELLTDNVNFKRFKHTFHLFSHGRSGELLVNNKWLNAKEIAAFVRTQNLSSKINNLNIYGCEFAKGKKGLQAVSYLEKTLGLKVNASTNITGKDGDWILETSGVELLYLENYSYNFQCPSGTLVVGDGPDEDYDGDGICNKVDLDDDNDGILDADEGYCEAEAVKDIVFVLDQSGSINTAEATVMVNGIKTFLAEDIGSGRDISFVVMEDDNVYGEEQPALIKVAMTGTSVPASITTYLDNWLAVANGPAVGRDYWASGFQGVIQHLGADLGPNYEVIVLSDGNQSSFMSTRTAAIPILNTGAHLFAIGPYDQASGSTPTVGEFQAVMDATYGEPTQEVTDYATDYETSEFDFVPDFSGLGTVLSTQLGVALCKVQDTDNDGIADYLDLDSDGDGCPDAIEGGGSFDADDLETSTIPGGNSGAGYNGIVSTGVQQNLGTDSNDDGTPNVEGTMTTDSETQTIGDSRTRSKETECCKDAVNYSYITDTDGDGIGDACDLDDDNDGILDEKEQENCEAVGIDNSNIVNSTASGTTSTTLSNGEVVTSSMVVSHPNLVATSSFDGYSSGVVRTRFSGPNQGNTTDYFEVSYTFDKAIKVQLSYPGAGTGSHGTTDVIQLIVSSGGFDINNPNNNSINVTENSATQVTFSPNSGGNDVELEPAKRGYTVTTSDAVTSVKLRFKNTDTMSNHVRIKISATCIEDTDNDGIPNHLDLDSDGDGCPDAIEGGGSFVNSQLVTDTNIDGGNTGGSFTGISGVSPVQTNLGTTVNANGIPTIVTGGTTSGTEITGQLIGISKNKAVESCTDTDGDGISDYVDLDDDNDGILDADEGYCEAVKDIVFVLDQSGSINTAEATVMVNGIKTFLAEDIGSGRDISFVVMEDDNVYGEEQPALIKVAMTGTSVPASITTYLDNWLAVANGPAVGRDYWASGFQGVIQHLGADLGPNYEVIVLTDGNQSNSTSTRTAAIPILNTGAHLFAIGPFDAAAFGSTPTVGEFQAEMNATYGEPTQEVTDYATDYETSEFDFVPDFSGLGTVLSTQLGVALCKVQDTDNDGIVDYLDLDSDGDGCPDAIEGGGRFVNSQLVTDTNIDGGNTGGSFSGISGVSPVQTNLGTTVNANGIPTIVTGGTTSGTETTGQSVGGSQDKNSATTCTDTDGDGINDYVDLDDDNDGILDEEEQENCEAVGIDNSNIVNSTASGTTSTTLSNGEVVTSSMVVSHPNLEATGTFDGYSSGVVSTRFSGTTNQGNTTDYFEVSYTFDKAIKVQLSYPGTAATGRHGTTDVFQLIVSSGGFDINNPNNNSINVTENSTTQVTFSPNSGGNDVELEPAKRGYTVTTSDAVTSVKLRFKNTDTVRNNMSIKISATCIEDTDNDGIPNHLDLDSDGDGCPDVIEAGVSGTLANGDIENGDGTTNTTTDTVNAVTTGPYGANGLANDLEDVDTSAATTTAAYTSTYNTYALDKNTNVCGVAMITQVYQSGTDKWIEVMNIDANNIVAPNAANVALFKDLSGEQTVNPTAYITNATALQPGDVILIRHSLSGINNIKGTPITNDLVTDFSGENDIIVVSRASNNKAWSSRSDIIESIKDNTAYVRIDEILLPNTTFTAAEWVEFVDDRAVASGGLDPYSDTPERHPHDPLQSEIVSSNIEANTLLGLHRFTPTTRTGSAWDNGFPDRSRHVIINENYSHVGARLNARKLSVNNNSKLAVTDQLLVVTNDITLTAADDEIRLVGTSQLVQTHTGATQVSGLGKLLVDQNSTVPSFYRYNYLSSPVNTIGVSTYTIESVLKDGTTPTNATGVINTNIAKDITFVDGYDGDTTDPISLAKHWVYTYAPGSNGRSNWVHKYQNLTIPQTDGFIMKGPGRAQNYTFVGTPKDGDLNASTVAADDSYLVGNPFSSAISVKKFIEDNLNSTTATLYFWQHVNEEDTSTDTSGHNFGGYIGGYATRNIAMGLSANDPTNSGPFDVTLEAEEAFINGSVVTNQSEDAVLMNDPTNFVEFRNIIKAVDTLTINYLSVDQDKSIILKIGGTTINEYTLPTTSTYSTFDVVYCVEAGSTVTIMSNDSNTAYINHLQLEDGDGNISCVPSAGGSDASLVPGAYIPIGQGFFIQGDATDGGPIVFNNSQREFITEAGDSQFFRGTTTSKTSSSAKNENEGHTLPVIKLGMDFLNEEGASIHRRMGISFSSNNSFAFDKGYDSEIYDLGATDVYWKFPNDDLKYIIAGVEEIADDLEIPFEIIMDYNGSIAIQIDEIKHIDREVFIEDKFTNKKYLLTNNTVALQLYKGTHTNRFALVFNGEVLSVDENPLDETLAKDLSIFADTGAKELVLQNHGNLEIGKVELYNILGQKIKQWKELENIQENRLKVKSLPNQIYIVKVHTDKGFFTKKIYIKN